MARLFKTISVDTSQKSYLRPRIVGISKLSQKPGLIPPAPKIDSITLPIKHENLPKSLNYRYAQSLDNPIDERILQALGSKS